MKATYVGPATVGFMVLAMAVVATGHWRGGLDIFGLTLVGAGVARLVLPRAAVGWLAVRHRMVDAAMLLGVGAAMVVLVAIVPTG